MKRRGRSDGANEFQSTLPARGATTSSPASCCRRCHFNPRSPHGERLFINSRKSFASGFQSTLPARGATLILQISRWETEFQSTLPARGATRTTRLTRCSPTFQSTLPARGATCFFFAVAVYAGAFQSTLPARGATSFCRAWPGLNLDFNPRSPHGERHRLMGRWDSWRRISIHAPRTGSDGNPVIKHRQIPPFQSTLPARGATPLDGQMGFLEEDFNPRSPHGERRWRLLMPLELLRFQSTLPARGATVNRRHSVTAYK